MISVFKWKEVKRLKAEGFGIKVIARKLKLSKNTVKKYLKSNIPPVFNSGGKKIVDFKHSFMAACRNAGLKDLRITTCGASLPLKW